jgi:hypothetical protein
MKIEIFDPPMCCSTGVCGPSVDEKLVRINENLEPLESKYMDLQVYRYMISQQPMKFKANKEVYELIQKNGRKILPITAFNEKVFKYGEYPSLEEIIEVIEESKNGN